MLEINPNKFKNIENKTIPSPLRPKFRNSGQTNIYFLSKRKLDLKKKGTIIKFISIIFSILLVFLASYFLAK